MNYSYYIKLRTLTKVDTIMYDLSFFHFFTVILVLIISFISFFIFTNIDSELDLQNDTIEDFSLMVGNIPKNAQLQEIQQTLEVNGIKPIEIIPTFKLSEYNEMKVKVASLAEKIRICNTKQLPGYKTLFSDYTPLEELNDQFEKECNAIDKLEEEFAIDSFSLNENIFSGEVIAVFNTEKDQTEFKKHSTTSNFSRIVKYFCLKNDTIKLSNLHIDTAIEPTDIIWENLEYTYGEKNMRTLLIYFLSLLMMLVSFVLLYILNIGQKKVGGDPTLKLAISTLFSLLINVINFVVAKVLIKVTDYEKPSSYSRYYFSVSLKLTLFTFINTAIIPTCVFLVSAKDGNYVESLKTFNSNLFMIFLINTIYPVYWLIDPMYFMTLFKRWRAEKHFNELSNNQVIDKERANNKDDVESKLYTQTELNAIFQNPDLELFLKYSYIGKTLLMSFFLYPFFPFAPIFSGLAFIFLYFIEKFKVGTKYRKPEQLNGEISIFYLSLTKLSISVYMILHFILEYVEDVHNSSDVAILVISLVLALIPY